jgi:hypothetical protein
MSSLKVRLKKASSLLISSGVTVTSPSRIRIEALLPCPL